MSVAKKAKVGMFVVRNPEYRYNLEFQQKMKKLGFSVERVFQISEVNYYGDMIRLEGTGHTWWASYRFDEVTFELNKLDTEGLL